MGKLNSTRAGALKLGQLIQESLDLQEPPWKRELLIKRLGEVGHETSMWTLSRMINGQTEKLDAALLLGISKLNLVCKPNGQPYSLEELILIGCEALLPETPPESHPFPAAIATIQKAMAGMTLDEFAAKAEISKRRLKEILNSTDPAPGKALPTWDELLNLARIINPKKPSVEALLSLYGYGSKQLTNGHSTL